MTDTTTLPKVMNQHEAAEFLGVGYKWLEYDRMRGPTIPYTRVGRHVRYRASDLVAYLDRQTVETA